jgi:predicted PurR-regulated permease PerM
MNGESKSQVSVKTVITVCATVLGIAILVYIASQTKAAITLTVGATLLAVALNHLVDALERRGFRRPLAIATVMVGLLVVFAGIGLLVIPIAVTQAKALINQAPQLIAKIKDTYLYASLNERFHLDEQLTTLLQLGTGDFQAAVERVLRAAGTAVSVVVTSITIFVLTIFLLVFGGRMVHGFLAEINPLHRERYERILDKIYDSIGGYLAGLLLIASVNACFTTIFLAINKVPFFLPLGITSGLLSLIPYLGPAVMAISTSLISLVTGGVWRTVITAGYFILYGQFEGQILSPLVYRRAVKVNPLVALLSVIFFVDLAGILGAVVAVPAAAAGQIIIREFLAFRRERLGSNAEDASREPSPPRAQPESSAAARHLSPEPLPRRASLSEEVTIPDRRK